MRRILLLALCIMVLALPVSAIITNGTQNNEWKDEAETLAASYIHDPNYMPDQYVYALALIGLFCLAVSRIWEQAEDIFAIAAVLPCAFTAWFANYMTAEKIMSVVMTDRDLTPNQDIVHVVYTQVIIPNPYLSLVFIVITICAVMNLIWIFFLKNADKKTEVKY